MPSCAGARPRLEHAQWRPRSGTHGWKGASPEASSRAAVQAARRALEEDGSCRYVEHALHAGNRRFGNLVDVKQGGRARC
jgi:hypothetical protein